MQKLKGMRGTIHQVLQLHLDKYCYWNMRREFQDLFVDFLNDIKVYQI